MKQVPAFLLVFLALPGLLRAQPDPTAAPAPAAPEAVPTMSLSLDEAVKRALENHPDIAVEKLGPESGKQGVREAQGAYDPLLTSSFSRSAAKTEGVSAFSGADRVDSTFTGYDIGASKLFATGGTVKLDFTNQRSTSNSVFEDFSPFYQSGLQARLVQPLLRNFKIDSARAQVRVAKGNQQISDAQFEQVVANTVANVKSLYYDLIYAMDNLAAQRKNLGLANQLLGENRIRVRVGTLAPLDVVAAESEVASREETVILAEAAVADAQDTLKRATLPRTDPSLWSLDIVPSDRPSADPVSIDVGAAMTRALEHRTDLRVARRNLENAETQAQLAASQKLPVVDLIAAYGTNGAGGNEIRRDAPGGNITEIIPGGYGDAVSDVFGRDFPTWTVGVNLAYPLFNRSASARAARATISRQEAAARLARLETDIRLEVRSAARSVVTNGKRVESTRSSRVLQERRLDAENKRFAAGMSTNFLVTQAQRDLALAEVAELRAVADYRKSLANFERVQVSGGGGVSFSTASVTAAVSAATPATSGSGTSTGNFGQ